MSESTGKNTAINPQTDKYERIPVLDMGPYLAGAPGAREQLAAEVRYVQENIWFYIVINRYCSVICRG